MIIFSGIAKKSLNNYSNINAKLSNDVKNKKLYRLTKGLYETDINTPNYFLANSIYGPSYISFDFALSYYNLIPEKVETVTCATYNKRKKKIYITPFGTYTYRDVPSTVYSCEVNLFVEGSYTYQIATVEKALCDKLYSISPLRNIGDIENLLFNDLRVDENELSKLNIDVINKLSKMYHSTNVNLLYKFIRRFKNE